MRVARYVGDGRVEIVEEAAPSLPEGGLLVQTEACGLCSGELMAWYMNQKVPHVLGHEVAGRVIASDDRRFSVGARVFPHHHAPCLQCDLCLSGRTVHCEQWRRTKLVPGGMADVFAVPAANLNDTLIVDDLAANDAALIEPLACVVKSLRLGGEHYERPVVIGLGVMGLMHALALGPSAVGIELSESRRNWATDVGIDARTPEDAPKSDLIFVCPGSQSAFDFAVSIASPQARIVLFAPLPPGQDLVVPQSAYFRDLSIANSYSCGSADTLAAAEIIRAGVVAAKHVISEFIPMEALPQAYQDMKAGRILKPMVLFAR